MQGVSGVSPTIPVTNLENAKRFYGDVVGLKPAQLEVPGHFGYDCGGGQVLFIYERPPSKAEHTLASFLVSDVDAAARDLKAKGIKFEDYDFPGLKTVDGIADMGGWKGGWFKDPDGNILAVGQLK